MTNGDLPAFFVGCCCFFEVAHSDTPHFKPTCSFYRGSFRWFPHTMSGGGGADPAYQGYPGTGGAAGLVHQAQDADLSLSASSFSSSTSGVVSGEGGSESSGAFLHQRLLSSSGGSASGGVSREQGVRDLRSIIQ